MPFIDSVLTSKQRTQLAALYEHASTLLDLTPHFRFFTLHGKQHFANLFEIVDILAEAGLVLRQDQAFLLGCCLCVHDVGMVVPLKDFTGSELFRGMPQPADPADLIRQIRISHHNLIDIYVKSHFDFLTSLGLSASDAALIRDISRNHRQVDLFTQDGFAKTLGALLRVIDELDVSPTRAPGTVLESHFNEMDATSCWHWFKHNITQEWRIGHNVDIIPGATPRITFKVAVHPQTASSIPYWLTQVRRPLARVLMDEGAARIVAETWGIHISAVESHDLSTSIHRGPVWDRIEEKALSANRKVILVIDDEVRKLHDLFLGLMNTYHVIFAQNAKDALDKMAARPVDLAIVDLQVGSGFQWNAEETKDFKMTGVRLCQEIVSRHPITKVAILTGSRHDLSDAREIPHLQFLLKKPVDPERFEQEVTRVLS
ncbi:MAG TPA: response regulator [Terracidiphilus sp.]|nr:response regulator [Terracidiphilus sp.]HWB10565.1 response regulator [Pirellulales bacterium]